MSSAGAGGGLSAGAITGIAVISVVAVGGIAFAATSGFGMLADSPPEIAATSPAPSPTDGVVPGERPEDGIIEDTLMERAFAAGKSVECNYTYEAYDSTTTMKSTTVFRTDRQMQGGLAHVIRGETKTYAWVEGTSVANEYETDDYESRDPTLFPQFDPVEFDEASTLDPTVCVEIPQADDELFTVPPDMTTTPAP